MALGELLPWKWAKIAEGLTDLPKLIRLLNDRFDSLQRWAATVIAQANNETDLNLLNFGATPDGVYDNLQAWLAAYNALPWFGGRIRMPPSRKGNNYYFSDGLRLQKCVHVLGVMVGQPVPSGPVGTAVTFAPDKTGFWVLGRDQYDDDYIFPNALFNAGLGGGEFSHIEKLTILSKGGQSGLLNGGTGVACDGVRVRAGEVRLTDLWIDGWKRNGVRMWATTGHPDPSMNANANLWRAKNVNCQRCGEDGFSVYGTDTNVGIAEGLDCTLNAGRGIYDGSFLGNQWIAPHMSFNSGHCFEHDNINAASEIADGYVEGAGGLADAQCAKGVIQLYAHGGLLCKDNTWTVDTTSLVIGGDGRILRGQLQHINRRGTTDIAISLGKDTTQMTVLELGSGDTSIPLADMQLHYDDVLHKWLIRDSGSDSNSVIEWPNRLLLATLRAFTMGARNGYYVGQVGLGALLTSGASMPISGTRNQGDYHMNQNKVVLGALGSQYVIHGWGRLTNGTSHVLNTDWAEDRGLTGT